MRSRVKTNRERLEHFFGDMLSKKQIDNILAYKNPSKRDIQEVCWEIYPKYTRLNLFRGECTNEYNTTYV